MAEELFNSYSRSFGVRSSVVRLFSIYGPELRKQLLWDLCIRLQAGAADLILGGTGNEQRDFLHVRDAARFLHAASARSAESCPAFNAGTGIATTVRDIAHHVCSVWGHHGPVFSGVVRAGDPAFLVADAAGARSLDLGGPLVTWQDGVAEYVQWFRSCVTCEG